VFAFPHFVFVVLSGAFLPFAVLPAAADCYVLVVAVVVEPDVAALAAVLPAAADYYVPVVVAVVAVVEPDVAALAAVLPAAADCYVPVVAVAEPDVAALVAVFQLAASVVGSDAQIAVVDFVVLFVAVVSEVQLAFEFVVVFEAADSVVVDFSCQFVVGC